MDIATPRADIAPVDVDVDEGGSKRRRVACAVDQELLGSKAS